MSKEIPVLVDVTPYANWLDAAYAEAKIFEFDGILRLKFINNGKTLFHVRDDADGCPVFGIFDEVYPKYAIHYPDGGEDWTTKSIFDELNGVPFEQEEEEAEEPVELTFTFIKEEKVGDLSVTEAIQVSQVIR